MRARPPSSLSQHRGRHPARTALISEIFMSLCTTVQNCAPPKPHADANARQTLPSPANARHENEPTRQNGSRTPLLPSVFSVSSVARPLPTAPHGATPRNKKPHSPAPAQNEPTLVHDVRPVRRRHRRRRLGRRARRRITQQRQPAIPVQDHLPDQRIRQLPDTTRPLGDHHVE